MRTLLRSQAADRLTGGQAWMKTGVPTGTRRISRRRFSSAALRHPAEAGVPCSWSALDDLTQATVPLGSSVLVTPSQAPCVAATESAVALPNSVVALTWATTRPFGFDLSAIVRPGSTRTIENEGKGRGG